MFICAWKCPSSISTFEGRNSSLTVSFSWPFEDDLLASILAGNLFSPAFWISVLVTCSFTRVSRCEFLFLYPPPITDIFQQVGKFCSTVFVNTAWPHFLCFPILEPFTSVHNFDLFPSSSPSLHWALKHLFWSFLLVGSPRSIQSFPFCCLTSRLGL